MLLFPKPTRKPKRPRRLNAKRKFKTNSNPFKLYKAAHTPAEVRAYASRCRQQRLDNPTSAELRMAAILGGLGIEFEREFILFHTEGTRFVILDFWLPNHKIVLEADGGNHHRQKHYDLGRDAFLQSHGIRTVRFTNKQILKTPEETAERLLAYLL